VLSAYCRHLGADLSIGDMIDSEIRCPFHFWRYDSDGACRAIPAGDAPPKSAHLFRFPCAESMGFIWAFNGEEPLYPVPTFNAPSETLALRAYRAPNILPVDPIVQLLNAFDLQHFQVVHGLDLTAETFTFEEHVVDCVFRFSAPELGEMRQERRVWGTTCVTMNGAGQTPIHMAAGLCALPGNRTQMYVVHATPKGDGAESILDTAQAYALRLIGEDWPILQTISFRMGLMTETDRLLGQALRWAERFPRAHPGGPFIT
jgi:phenylpropionate dioxygenase-like ring-hydroxylating dioxygenase large terminal subunit